MAVSKAQQRAVNKYVKNNYDEIKVRMPKGKKEVIQAHAAQQGESVNAYINRAIDKAMSEDNSSTCFFKSLFSAVPRAWYNNGTGGGDADEYNDNL